MRTLSRRASAQDPIVCFAAAIMLATLAGCAATGQTPLSLASSCISASSEAGEADAIQRLEERGARVNVEGWSLEEARDFFAPTWVSVGSDGAVRGVDEVYATFIDGRSRPWATSFSLLELDIRVYCDVAIVIGLAEAHGPSAKQVMRVRYLNVWRRMGGRWRYSEQQYVRV